MKPFVNRKAWSHTISMARPAPPQPAPSLSNLSTNHSSFNKNSSFNQQKTIIDQSKLSRSSNLLSDPASPKDTKASWAYSFRISYRPPQRSAATNRAMNWSLCSSSAVAVGAPTRASPSANHLPHRYLKLQNEWPRLNTKSSVFRGNSPFFLHFQ